MGVEGRWETLWALPPEWASQPSSTGRWQEEQKLQDIQRLSKRLTELLKEERDIAECLSHWTVRSPTKPCACRRAWEAQQKETVDGAKEILKQLEEDKAQQKKKSADHCLSLLRNSHEVNICLLATLQSEHKVTQACVACSVLTLLCTRDTRDSNEGVRPALPGPG